MENVLGGMFAFVIFVFAAAAIKRHLEGKPLIIDDSEYDSGPSSMPLIAALSGAGQVSSAVRSAVAADNLLGTDDTER